MPTIPHLEKRVPRIQGYRRGYLIPAGYTTITNHTIVLPYRLQEASAEAVQHECVQIGVERVSPVLVRRRLAESPMLVAFGRTARAAAQKLRTATGTTVGHLRAHRREQVQQRDFRFDNAARTTERN